MTAITEKVRLVYVMYDKTMTTTGSKRVKTWKRTRQGTRGVQVYGGLTDLGQVYVDEVFQKGLGRG